MIPSFPAPGLTPAFWFLSYNTKPPQIAKNRETNTIKITTNPNTNNNTTQVPVTQLNRENDTQKQSKDVILSSHIWRI